MGLNFPQNAPPDSAHPLGGRYKIIQQLGAGGFGHTFLAQDRHLPGHPRCVVKQLKPQFTSDQELQVARRLFETEANVLYRLGSHPQIPRLLAHFEETGEFYLAQELIEGHSLDNELSTAAAWPDPQVIAFLGDILSTLAFVHGRNVIHRDLKPSNLIRRHSDNRIVVIDFGAVKQVGTQLVASKPGISHTISIGTQGYMPNEQIAGRPQFSSDVYAVGMIAIQALSGRHPSAIPLHPRTGELDWHALAPHCHPSLAALLDYMVRYDFRTRYATAAEALAALKAFPPELCRFIPPLVEAHPHLDAPPIDPPPYPQPSYAPPYQPSPSMAVQTVAVGRHPDASAETEPVRRPPIKSKSRRSQLPPKTALIFGVGVVAALGAGGLAALVFTPAPPIETAATPSQESPPLSEQGAPIPETRAEPDISPPEAVPNLQSEAPPTEAPAVEAQEPSAAPTQTEPAAAEASIDEAPVNEAPVNEDLASATALTPEIAATTVTSLYAYIAAQAWDEARSVFGDALAQEFSPSFFQQFQQVTVENLRVTNQTADTVEFIGQNTYVYPDGGAQREERTFTVQTINGQPRIVSSAFVRITKGRYD